jgi:Raf kinase inhibitor-like YbhB/YbcL family protein
MRLSGNYLTNYLMKLPYKILIGLVGGLALVLLAVLFQNYLHRSGDADFHAKLKKTLMVTSSDFADNDAMPAVLTHDGADLSPQLSWANAPAGTKSYVILAMDYDAPSPSVKLLSIVHWLVFNLPSTCTSLPQGVSRTSVEALGAKVGDNFGGEAKYIGPAPPVGTHEYHFWVYALDVNTLLPTSRTKHAVMKAMEGHVLGYGELVGTYSAK